ncbi:MAG: C39 family peptidase [Armatimonadetes bacterium]|nr:C39 family peptidase [Armatimonadota bacterium]
MFRINKASRKKHSREFEILTVAIRNIIPFALLLGLLVASAIARAELPRSFKINGVPRIKQLTNYCGPACAAAVFEYLGREMNQETAGKIIYDPSTKATSGSEMLLFGIENGFAAYSWNSGIQDVKSKLAAGIPVIVLQQNSITDTSGHYRVLTGYDDAAGKFHVMDPYYDDITELTYQECEQLWRPTGYWSLIYVPRDRDTFKEELGTKNPVIHIDLSIAKFKRKQYEEALEEANKALALEPENHHAISILGKIKQAMGAGK